MQPHGTNGDGFRRAAHRKLPLIFANQSAWSFRIHMLVLCSPRLDRISREPSPALQYRLASKKPDIWPRLTSLLYAYTYLGFSVALATEPPFLANLRLTFLDGAFLLAGRYSTYCTLSVWRSLCRTEPATFATTCSLLQSPVPCNNRSHTLHTYLGRKCGVFIGHPSRLS